MPRPTTLPEPWRSYCLALESQWAEAHPEQTSPGGVTLAARELVCDARTFRRWANGETQPDRRAQELIRQAFDALGLQSPL